LFVFVFCFLFCWQLLICENTLIQVVKLKKEKKRKEKQKKKFQPSLRAEPGSSDINPLGHERLLSFFEVNFNTYFFLRDKLPIRMKKPKSTSSAIFGVETAAKSCELKRCADRVRTELTEPTRQI